MAVPPEHWLALAKEARDSAEHVRDRHTKHTLVMLAQRYEARAARAEKLVGAKMPGGGMLGANSPA
jgi:hypothetical protein